jgi:hypothetical protein
MFGIGGRRVLGNSPVNPAASLAVTDRHRHVAQSSTIPKADKMIKGCTDGWKAEPLPSNCAAQDSSGQYC